MTTPVIMPALGMAQDTGKIIRWHKHSGELVTQGDTLLEVETDKVTVDIPAPASGRLAEVRAAAGDDVPVGQAIAVILAQHAAEVAAVQRRRPLASPKARHLAAEHGLNLSALIGSGPGGAVVAKDVAHLLAASQPAVGRQAKEGRGAPASETSEDGTDAPARSAPAPLAGVWRVMAERTTQSWTSVPHFVLTRDVDASRLQAWRALSQGRLDQQITYTDLFVKLVAAALRQHPRFQTSWVAGQIVVNETIGIGIAVATNDGLVVPVIQQADQLTLGEIAQRRADLVARAHSGSLGSTDVYGCTFTISNLGMYGVDTFNAIINPPNAGILALGRIAERVVAVSGQPVIRPMLSLSLSCDHRVVDGVRGAQFLGALAEFIEEPLLVIV
jgi:pyruvate dehydrogenase E2 component (dihydrolipoamide acetyltransferase)